jgi:hypothetical protein
MSTGFFYGGSNVDTPRLLHLYDGEGTPLKRGVSQKNSALNHEHINSPLERGGCSELAL